MSSAPPERPDRHITLVKPDATAGERATTAIQLLESMLWAFQGTTRSNWIISPIEENAHVVVIHAVDCDQRVSQWQQNGKTVVVIVTDPEPSVTHEYVLHYPFRATQVLEVLESLDTQASSSTGKYDLSAVVASWVSTETSEDSWSFLEAVEMLREVQNADVWLAGKIGKTTVLWVKGDCSEYSADAIALHAIRSGELPLRSVKLQKGLPPPAHRTPRAAAELVWFAGYHASPELAPWLTSTTHYQITRWPDFGLIRPLPSQIRATATLSKAPHTLEEIAQLAQISVEEAARMLNALSACKLLTASTGDAKPATDIRHTIAEPPGGFKSFLRLVRRRLGLNDSP
jgi:hypothetical protein